MLQRIDENDEETDESELDYSYYIDKYDVDIFENVNNEVLFDKYQTKIDGLNKIIKELRKKNDGLQKQVNGLNHALFHKKIEVSQLECENARLKNNTDKGDTYMSYFEDCMDCLCLPLYACQMACIYGGIKLKKIDK